MLLFRIPNICKLIIVFFSFFKVWFKNRRAKWRKQKREEQERHRRARCDDTLGRIPEGEPVEGSSIHMGLGTTCSDSQCNGSDQINSVNEVVGSCPLDKCRSSPSSCPQSSSDLNFKNKVISDDKERESPSKFEHIQSTSSKFEHLQGLSTKFEHLQGISKYEQIHGSSLKLDHIQSSSSKFDHHSQPVSGLKYEHPLEGYGSVVKPLLNPALMSSLHHYSSSKLGLSETLQEELKERESEGFGNSCSSESQSFISGDHPPTGEISSTINHLSPHSKRPIIIYDHKTSVESSSGVTIVSPSKVN